MIDYRQYRDSKWVQYRNEIYKRDGYKCIRCGKGISDGIEIQAHHIGYLQGKKPWEYPYDMVITYCKGCHAEEHGHIMPSYGWEYLDFEDLEDLVGECEKCGTPLRYVHYIQHKKWGILQVGCNCAETLTQTDLASQKEKEIKSYVKSLRVFLTSSRWRVRNNCHSIKLDEFKIFIWDNASKYRLVIEARIKGRFQEFKGKEYLSLENAKSAAFKAIRSGEFEKYLNKKYPDR